MNLVKDEIIDNENHIHRSDNNSEDFEEVNDGQYSSFKLIDDSCFISLELNDFFESSLPKLVKGCKRVLIYSTLKHGISLRTLTRNSAQLTTPGLLVLGELSVGIVVLMLEIGYEYIHKWSQLHKHKSGRALALERLVVQKRWNTLLFKAVISGEDLCPEMNALTIQLAVRAPALNMVPYVIPSSRWWFKCLAL
ncbi:hypothetical protein MTR_1g044700 [Medicago truncatula]|uniref:Uncharacterized protein n=1 Tax=Medicago truncatula TaxID=3880 RepID=G7I630_MEDTR|nr:hypothetical protein MTR_1g044700 [Medicago truncatula]